MKMNMCI